MEVWTWFATGAFIVVILGEILKELVKYVSKKKQNKKELDEERLKKLDEEELMKKINDQIDYKTEKEAKPRLDKMDEDIEEFKNEVSSKIDKLKDLIESKMEKDDEARKLINHSQKALLRDRLHELANRCFEKGFASDYERLTFNDMFENYAALGGNHEMEAVKEQFFDLPLIKPVQKKVGRPKKIVEESKED